MAKPELLISLHEELERREKLQQQLTEECEALRQVLTLLKASSSEAPSQVPRVVRLTPAKVDASKKPAEMLVCAEHPNGKRTRDGKCQPCQNRTYQREWAARNKKDNRQTAKANGHAPEFEPELDPDPPGPAPAARAEKVRCSTCNESFNDAKSMGIHKTRVHFGDRSETGSTLGGL